MISYSFEYPAAWSATIETARAGWPTLFAPWNAPPRQASDDAERREQAQIRGWFGPALLAGGLPAPAGPDATTAVVVGREPMAPVRVTSWFKRVAAPLATAAGDRDAMERWDVGDCMRRFDLPAGPAAARIARGAVREVLAGTAHVDDAMLATSELTANAVQHGGGAVDLRIHTGAGAVAIEVCDGNPRAHPRVIEAPVMSVAGRGMSIVDVIAAHWGVTVRAGIKSVWCEFPL